MEEEEKKRLLDEFLSGEKTNITTAAPGEESMLWVYLFIIAVSIVEIALLINKT
ncbi:hypothetical protein KY317_01600 [Candidatus Woesearchaeota archaeon]|nr:hypothetical protein [Candidatus Woesearchaeota archaeon]